MLLLACHNCGALGTYTVRLQELVIHEQGKKKGHGDFSKAVFCPEAEDKDTLGLLKMGNARIAVLLQLGFALIPGT